MFNMSSNEFNKCMALFDSQNEEAIFKLNKEQIEYIKNILDNYLDLQLTLIYYGVKNVGELKEYVTGIEHKLQIVKDNITVINNCLKEV